MKHAIIFLTFMQCICIAVFSQKTNLQIGLDQRTFKKVLNEQFSSLVTGQSKTSIGNFAALDLKESEVSFSGNSITNKGHVLGIKASGGVSDGILSVFNNSSLNTKIALEGQFNFLSLKKRSLIYYDDSYKEYVKKTVEIDEKYRTKCIEAENEVGLINLKYKKKKIESAIQKINQRLISGKDQLTIDSLKYAMAQNKSDLFETDKAIQNYPKKENEIEDINNWRAVELKKIKPDLDLYGFKFGWLSVNYKVSNSSFKLFNPKLTVSNQVIDSAYISHELKVQYNKYNWTKESFKTYFYCIGLSFSITDNLPDLSKKEITEVTNYGTNPNEITTTKKYNAFLGDYEKGLKQFKLFCDYYRFLLNNNIAALHVYPECQFRDKSKPVYNLGFGFLYAFKDSKTDNKIVINAEIFYDILDITNNNDTDLGLFERNNIGLRFSFPINFIYK